MKKLFCIPGAGASAVMFLPWMKELNGSEDFKLCLLEIPGRGMRKKDAPVKTMEELVDVLIQKMDIQLKPDESYVIYGYCFGAIIGYELCRKLRMLGKKEPEHFFCSSIGSPGNRKIAEPVFANHSFRGEIRQMFVRYFPEQLFTHTESLGQITELYTQHAFDKFDETQCIQPVSLDELMQDCGELAGKEENLARIVDFANDALDIFQYDQQMLLDYSHSEHEPFLLECPLTVMRGEQDTLTGEADLMEWKDYCDGGLALKTVCGNHFTFEESRDEIMGIIQQESGGDSMMILDI